MPHEVPGRVPDPVPTLSMQLCGAVQGKGSDSHSSDRQQQDSVQACTVQARGTSFQGQDHVAGPLPPGSSISDGRGIAIGMIRGVPARNGALRQGSLLDTARWMGIFATLCCCMPQHGGAVEILMFVPVYEWVPVWKDWRNSDYKMGSIWRPKMIEHFNRTDFPGEMNRRVDGYDIREYATFDFDVVYFGDVFMKGHEPPNFVGSVIMATQSGQGCPEGIPCFERDLQNAKFKALMFVTPDRNLFERVWYSKLDQCATQNSVGVPKLCTEEFQEKKYCEPESGFAAGEIPISIQRPSCPNDYYVLGHIAFRELNGSMPAEIPTPHYKCLHESLLRKGKWTSAPLFTGAQPRTSPWNPTLKTLKWKDPFSLWQADCTHENCDRPYCVDHFSRGLFYANNNEVTYNDQVTGAENSAPAAGPKCFNIFRDCVGNDGKGTNIADSNPPWNLFSDCDAENSHFKGEKNEGIFRVIPSGIPNMYSMPIELTLHVSRYLCDRMRLYIDDINPDGFGTLAINGVMAQWTSMKNVELYCEIKVMVPLDGRIKPGPARIDIEAQTTTTDRIIKKDDGSCAAFPYCRTIGRSVGRLYVYKEPSADATIIEPTTVNNNECNLFLVVRLPAYTAAAEYNTNTFCNWRQKGMQEWQEAEQPGFVQYDHLGIAGVKCFIPQLTNEEVYLQVCFNADREAKGQYHSIDRPMRRYGHPWSVIATDQALRLYGISPKSGPQTGGTMITVSGQYFSKYCGQNYCNAIQCHFIFEKAGGVSVKAVDATVINDKTMQCLSPKTVPEVWNAKVQISVDMNAPCSTLSDDEKGYNQAQFVYQTDVSKTAIPAEGPRSVDVKSTPHRLQSVWYKCQSNYSLPNYVDCAGWPGLSGNSTSAEHRDNVINHLGHYNCLAGFSDENGKPTSNTYPVWCFRALPLNAASSYLFTFTDPFFNNVLSLLRPVPIKYPGYCHRTNHHFGWQRIVQNLDYRFFDVYDKNYSYGSEKKDSKITQGRNLIDRLWSTTAIQFTIPYMREIMHQVGEKYGFIDLGTIFSISVDFTLAQEYDEKQHRRHQKCDKPPAKTSSYSGELGDGGARGTFVNWTAHNWIDGKGTCSVDDRWAGQCSQEIVRSPNRDDDVGVMITTPASLKLKDEIKDEVVGCGRMRVSFNCSRFSINSCLDKLVSRDINSARYRNTGSKQDYSSLESWCRYMYPETAGPNNPDTTKGWDATKPIESDWLYLYRHSPCVRCRQAAELCSSLKAVDSIIDGVPGPPEYRGHGDKDAAVEIELGCFGSHTTPVEDRCCDNALDTLVAPPIRGKCIRSLERCVRPRNNYLCAKDDNRDGLCSDEAENEWPLCAPRNLV